MKCVFFLCQNLVLSSPQGIPQRFHTHSHITHNTLILSVSFYTPVKNKSFYLLTLKAFSRSGSLLSPSKFSSLTSSSSSSSSSSLFPVDEASSVMLTSSRGCSEARGLWNNEKYEWQAPWCCCLLLASLLSSHYVSALLLAAPGALSWHDPPHPAPRYTFSTLSPCHSPFPLIIGR